MPFNLKVKNFGKLSDAEVNIGQFTVFAGPNNTGKSSVSKLLYSLLGGMNVSGMNESHALFYFYILADPLRKQLNMLERMWDGGSKDFPFFFFYKEIGKMESLVGSFSPDDFTQNEKYLPKLSDSVEKLYKKFKEYKEVELPKQRSEIRLHLSFLESSLNWFCKRIKETSSYYFTQYGIQYKISDKLVQNFQVDTPSSLIKKNKKHCEVSIDGIGQFEFKENSTVVNADVDFSRVVQLQDYSRVIYLESPIYWKLRLALENIRLSRGFVQRHRYSDNGRLTGVPGYFYDLANALRDKRTGDITFPKVYKKLTSKKVMGGKLTISENGNLNFQENKHSFPLSLTAMGVVNLGILALLIERKLIGEGSFLFIDEPEAHLHPSWQVVMAETLFELAKGGVKVVIATHSADILKWLEVHIKKNPEDKDLVALNQFTFGEVKKIVSNFDVQLANIQQELTEPFAKLFVRGV